MKLSSCFKFFCNSYLYNNLATKQSPTVGNPMLGFFFYDFCMKCRMQS